MCANDHERKDKSRLHLSKYVVDASERAAQSNGDLEIAGKVQKVAQVHGSVWTRGQKWMRALRTRIVVRLKR
jgi:hypothetical protein